MAEFKDVMKKYKAMCDYESCENGCPRCPLGRLMINHNVSCKNSLKNYPEEAEAVIMHWEKPVDWRKVPIDTKILVKANINFVWLNRYFAGVRDGMVTTFDGGATSWSNSGHTTKWEFAKLAEEGEQKND